MGVSIHAPRAGATRPAVNNSNHRPFQHLIANLLLPLLPLDTPPPRLRQSLIFSIPYVAAPTSPRFAVRFRSRSYTIRGPSGSYDSLVPTCSTRPFQLSPRK